ncbi:MAG TPA: SufD family Fe-S cluster assembly protein [Thermoplasmata archaeon]|nr:SufD family Fe-S cluster assembly protein [Thermoplasmata archaeon]
MATATTQRPWLREEEVRDLSESLADPEAVAQHRAEAYRLFLELPMEPNPLYRHYGYFSGVDLSGIDPVAHGASVALPPALPDAVRIVHDGSGTRIEIPPALRELGVSANALIDSWKAGATALPTLMRGSETPADRLSALSIALLNRGYRLEIPDRCPTPIRVQDITVLSQAHEAQSIRRSIRIGERAQVLITEELYCHGPVPTEQRFYGSSVDYDLAAEAKVVHLSVHAPDGRTVSFYRRSATTERRSRLAWIWAGLGGFSTRGRNQTTLIGNGSSVDDLQTFYGRDHQSYDSDVHITHRGEDTHGQSITRGVFRDESRGMSRGLVRIEPLARKTLSYISEHAMLLSRGARSDTIPILEILCPDVKATHSTSVAPVDPEKIFYLESRGISPSESVRAIGEGFLSYVLDRAPIAGLRETLYPLLAARWEGKEIDWGDPAYPPLPELEVAGTAAAPDWRFDAKLR